MKHLDEDDINILHFVNIATHSQQLEAVYFQGFTIMKEMIAHVLTQLPLKWLFFKNCTIAEEVAQVAVDTLKKFDHSFCKIGFMDIDEYSWHQRISDELLLLTWSNQFQHDRDQLIEFYVCPASVDFKLDLIHKESPVLDNAVTLQSCGILPYWIQFHTTTKTKTHWVVMHLTCFILSSKNFLITFTEFNYCM